MQQSISQKKKLNLFKTFVALSYTMPSLLKTIFSLTSVTFPQSNKDTKNTSKQVAKILNYLASNPNAEIQYRANGMQLDIHSDTSYLLVSQARSRASEVHFLREGPPNPNNPEYFFPTVNGILLVVCKIMRNIISSAADVEYGTILVNAQTDVPIQTNLTKNGIEKGTHVYSS